MKLTTDGYTIYKIYMAVKKKSKKSEKRKTTGLLKLLEGVVLLGTVAAVLIKVFKSGKKKS